MVPQTCKLLILKILAITGLLVSLNACNSTQKTGLAANAEAAQIPYQIERWQRDIAVTEAIKSIKIQNLHGNLTVKQTTATSVGISGVEQKLGRAPESAQFEVRTVDGQLRLSIIYASDALNGADAMVDGHLKGRVDLVVFVPKTIAVEFQTSFADLVVRKLHNPIRASTGSGRMSVSNTLASELSSETGNINYLPSDCAAARGVKIRTNGGRAVVDVPTYCALRLDVNAKSLIVGQERVALNAGHWQRQFPNASKPSPANDAVMRISAPKAELTLSLMQEKNHF